MTSQQEAKVDRTAVIFDRDGTLVDEIQTAQNIRGGMEHPAAYYDGVVEAVDRIRTKHLCAIATTNPALIPMHGVGGYFK